MSDLVHHNPPELPPICDFPELGQKLTLMCESCGRKEAYHVGRVIIDPFKIRSYSEQNNSFEDAVVFSGIFYCQHCGADGPWEIPLNTRMGLLAILALPSSQVGEYGVQIGKMQLFDGTVTRTGAEAEAYLKQKIEEQPENAFLWSRLGNLYEHAGFAERAREAFEKSVHLDPTEVESQASLGEYYMNDGDWTSAAECFEAALVHAPARRHQQPKLMKELVRACLKFLWNLHNETRGEVRFPPTFSFSDEGTPTKPRNLGLLELDVQSEEGWETLTSLYLTGKVPEHARQGSANKIQHRAVSSDEDLLPSEVSRLEGGGTIRGTKRVGRNEPCPCGSGKKYKRCCLRK